MLIVYNECKYSLSPKHACQKFCCIYGKIKKLCIENTIFSFVGDKFKVFTLHNSKANNIVIIIRKK